MADWTWRSIVCFSSLDSLLPSRKGFPNTCLSYNTENALVIPYLIYICKEITTLSREKRMLYLFLVSLVYKLEKQNWRVNVQ